MQDIILMTILLLSIALFDTARVAADARLSTMTIERTSETLVSPATREADGNNINSLYQLPATPLPTYTAYPGYFDPFKGFPDSRLVSNARNVGEIHNTSSTISSTSTRPQGQGNLKRDLHIPTKRRTISSGFSMPPLLASCGVSLTQWHTFQSEIHHHGGLSGGQWTRNIAASWGIGIIAGAIVPLTGPVAAVAASYTLRSRREKKNFLAAHNNGILQQCLDRWNIQYFEQLGLHVAVEMPKSGNMHGADVASTKLFRFQQRRGIQSQRAGTAGKGAQRRELRYQYKEGRQRVKALRRGRVVVTPWKMVSAAVSAVPEA